MAFPPEFLDEIRARVALADVIGRRVKLTRRGRELLGLCPFHNEKTPSFSVVEDKGFYHCFGCGAHGDVIGFVMRHENLPFPEAVERLAGEAGIAVPQLSPEERVRERERHSLYSVVEAACAWFEAQLAAPAGARAREYLEGRGVSAAMVETFRLGFAPDSRGALKTALAGQDISEAMMLAAGLLVQPEDSGREPYDRFRGRLIFPITDRRGRVIAFGGRILGEGEPKYLNSPETAVFHKGTHLYGYALAAERARRKNSVVAVEGYMDVIALHQAGITNAVAPLGTAITEAQVEALWRLAPEPVLCFDGDVAGRRAAFRAGERVLPRLRAGHSLRFAWLPAGEDPDSLLGDGGPERLREVLGQAGTLADLLWELAMGKDALATPERQAGVRQRLRELVAQIPDADLRFYFERHFQDRIWKALRAERDKGRGGKAPGAARSPGHRDEAPSRDLAGSELSGATGSRERRLLQILLLHPELVAEVAEEIAQLDFASRRLDALRDAILGMIGPEGDASAELAQTLSEDERVARTVVDLTGREAQAKNWQGGGERGEIKAVRSELRQILDRQQLGDLERFKREAEASFAADPSERNLEKLNSAIRMLHDAPGREEEIQD
jgi:DNA primase